MPSGILGGSVVSFHVPPSGPGTEATSYCLGAGLPLQLQCCIPSLGEQGVVVTLSPRYSGPKPYV